MLGVAYRGIDQGRRPAHEPARLRTRGLPGKKDEQDVKKHKQDLPTWLVDQLTINYPELAKPEAQALLEKQLLLPILDGLDELPESVHARALYWINRWLKPGVGLVVSCRTDNYKNAVNSPRNEPLRGTAGVEVRDLDPEDVRAYLQYNARGADRWNLVLELLGTKTPVGWALRTPLMVSLARTSYNSPAEDTESPPEPDELCNTEKFPTSEAVEQHLFNAFINATYGPEAEKSSHKPYRCSAADAKTWLAYLATHLKNLSPDTPKETTDDDKRTAGFAWWQLRYAAPRHLSGLAVGIVSGIATGFTAGFGEDVGAGIGIGLGLGRTMGSW